MSKNNVADQNAVYHVSLKIVLKNKKGQILILKMPPKSSMAGYFDLPGGRIRELEWRRPFAQIIRREIREEVGREARYKLREVPVAISRHFYFSKKYNREQHLFWVFLEATYEGGKIRVSSEHYGYLWADINKRNLKKYFIRGPLEGMQNYFSQRFVKMRWQ